MDNLADPLRHIRDYNDEMTISQVIRYFERQGIFFTKPMIQGYVRAGVLPQPKERRYYTRGHMVLLALIDILRKGYTSEEIKRLFGVLGMCSGAGSDNSEEMLTIYEAYTALTKEVLAAMNGLSVKLAMNSEAADAGAIDGGGPVDFLVPAALMTGSVMLKEAAEKILSGRESPRAADTDEKAFEGISDLT